MSVLLAHIIAVKTTGPGVTDESMDYPRDWDTVNPTPSPLGHQEMGRTIVLHSVAVAPEFQGKGLGQVLMKAYFGLMNGAGIADRLALIAHDVSLFTVNCLSWGFDCSSVLVALMLGSSYALLRHGPNWLCFNSIPNS